MPQAKEESFVFSELIFLLKCKQAEMCRVGSTGSQQAKRKLKISELSTPQSLVGTRKASSPRLATRTGRLTNTERDGLCVTAL